MGNALSGTCRSSAAFLCAKLTLGMLFAGTESSDKLATRHLSFFLQTFEMEYDFLETLADLGLNRADLTPR
eukprot:2225197-Rhodomonas_salina.2